MTTPTLSHLTLQTLDNYRTAANQAVVAYRLGSRRLVSVVNATLENSVYPRTAKLAPVATRRMDGVRGTSTSLKAVPRPLRPQQLARTNCKT